MSAVVSPEQAEELGRCLSEGGVAVFPSDTVYGLACDPGDREAHARLCAIKGRDPEQPCALMFFSLDDALGSLPELGERTRAALAALLPGPVLALLPNTVARYPLACGEEVGTLGLRVPALAPATAALAGIHGPILQTSANLSGGPEPARLDEVPGQVRDAADLEIDGGELPGVPSTAIDLRSYEADGGWAVLREGALSEVEVAALIP